MAQFGKGETLTSILDHRLVERYKGGCQAEYKGGSKTAVEGKGKALVLKQIGLCLVRG